MPDDPRRDPGRDPRRSWLWAGPAEAAPLADDLARTGARRRRGAGRAGPGAARGGRRARRARLHPGGAGARARTARPAPPAGPGLGPARRPLGRARGLQRRAAARSIPGARLVRARAHGGGAGATGRAARAAYERALDLLPTYRAAALALADLLRRTRVAPRGDRGAGRVSSRPIPTSSRRSPPWAGRCSRTAAPTQALEAFARVLRFDPEHAGALYYRAPLSRGSGGSRGGRGLGAGGPARSRRALRRAGAQPGPLGARPPAHLRTRRG